MPVILKELTDRQKLYIRQNHKRMYKAEMSRNLGNISIRAVRGFMDEENLEPKMTRSHCIKIDRKVPEGIFNVFERENWLI
jgi:hypothetical protein